MNILQKSTNRTIKAYKTKRPKFGNKKATWSDSSVLINGEQVNVFWECMRGANYYLEFPRHSGNWYRIPFNIGKRFCLETNLDEIKYNDEWEIK